jgi:hypothetical protein
MTYKGVIVDRRMLEEEFHRFEDECAELEEIAVHLIHPEPGFGMLLATYWNKCRECFPERPKNDEDVEKYNITVV